MNRGRALAQLSKCIRGKLPSDPDWPAILALANQELITAELHSSLALEQNVPDEVKIFLAEVHRRNHARNVGLFETLKGALAALNPARIEPILLKGCATWVEGDELASVPATGRISSDLDLLAPAPLFTASVEALLSAGFEILEDNRSVGHHPVVVMFRSGDRGTIDLHQFPPGPRGISHLDNLSAHSRSIECGGFRAKVPTPELQILVVTLHDQLLDGHFWRGGFELRHLIDIAELSKRATQVDWDLLYKIGRRTGLANVLAAQLLAARDIAGAAVPMERFSGLEGMLHYWRQRLQYVWPAVNAPFHWIGLNKFVWRSLSSRDLSEVRADHEPSQKQHSTGMN